MTSFTASAVSGCGWDRDALSRLGCPALRTLACEARCTGPQTAPQPTGPPPESLASLQLQRVGEGTGGGQGAEGPSTGHTCADAPAPGRPTAAALTFSEMGLGGAPRGLLKGSAHAVLGLAPLRPRRTCQAPASAAVALRGTESTLRLPRAQHHPSRCDGDQRTRPEAGERLQSYLRPSGHRDP